MVCRIKYAIDAEAETCLSDNKHSQSETIRPPLGLEWSGNFYPLRHTGLSGSWYMA